jgi:serine phosphatase RsbU (regulator of sigma subunit)/Tfp pilus assembly protein PilF
MRREFILLVTMLFIAAGGWAQEKEDPKLDSLQQELKASTHDTTRIIIHCEIASHVRKQNVTMVRYHLNKALELLDKRKTKNDFYYNYRSNVLNGLGLIERGLGNLSEALEYYLKSYELALKTANEDLIGSRLFNIGAVHRSMKDYDKAEEYFMKSLDIRLQVDNITGVTNCYNALGIINRKRKEYDKAKSYYEMSLKLALEKGLTGTEAQAYSNLGVLHSMKKEPDSAIVYFNKALVLNRSENNRMDIGTCYLNLANAYVKKKQFDVAEPLYNKALGIYILLGNKEKIAIVNRKLSALSKHTNRYEDALKYYKRFIQYRDSVFNQEQTREIAQKEAAFKYEQIFTADSLKNVQEEQIKDAKRNAERQQEETLRNALYAGLALVLVFAIFIFNRFRVTRKQKGIIEFQKEIVEEKNKEITDSITYAKRLQEAILPPQKLVKEYLSNSFILYKPKDIVAGDFYWMETVNDLVLFASADCTGHGVPGAMVSVVCSNALNRGVREMGITDPGKLLGQARELVVERFEKSETEVKDGMDISLCVFNTATNELKWAGANNPLWMIRNKEIIEIKPDKQSVGVTDNPKPFTTHTTQLQSEDVLYIFTDGFADQFGGPKEKKYKYKPFKEFLLSIQNQTLEEQKNALDEEFENWRGDLEQVDDVCIIGVKI